MSELYDQLLEELRGCLSTVNARSILSRAMRKRRIAQNRIARTDLPELVPHIERSAALFLRPDEHKRLQVALAALWRTEDVASETIEILEEKHIVDARSRARHMCIQLGARGTSSQKVATIVSELARNIVLYTPGGRIEIIPRSPPPRVTIRATDRGSGIARLDEVLAGTYESKTGLGCGLRGTKRVSSSFRVDTGSSGTCVEAEIVL